MQSIRAAFAVHPILLDLKGARVTGSGSYVPATNERAPCFRVVVLLLRAAVGVGDTAVRFKTSCYADRVSIGWCEARLDKLMVLLQPSH
jgi:hypothetical protein